MKSLSSQPDILTLVKPSKAPSILCFFVILQLSLGLSAALHGADSKEATLTKIDLVAKKTPNCYSIDGAEVTVNGLLLKRVELGKTTAIITYFNKSDRRMQPKFRFRLLNSYGMEIAAFEDRWIIDELPPNETGKENKSFRLHSLDSIFQHTGLKLPEDWQTPQYLIIDSE